jgi:5-methylcytosine-specific restriction endonuclease McrA
MSAAATVERLNRAWDVLAVRNAHEAWSWWLENAPDWWKRARETHRREMQLGWWLASTHKKRAAELGVPSDVDGRALTSLMTKATHCHWCGDPLTRDIYGGGVNRWTDATYDHVVPLCEGGANTISNIVIAHAGCNYARDERAGRFVAKYGTVCA